MIRSALMNVMTAAAIKAGRGLKRDFGEVENLQVSVKGPADFVSAADKKRGEDAVRGIVAGAAGLWLPDGGRAATSREPTRAIAGSSIRSTARPISCTACRSSRSTSRWSGKGQIVAGLTYNPIADEMYMAEKGQGAWFNNRRLRVSARRDMADALIACGVPPLGRAAQHPKFKAELAAVMARADNVRRLGAAALDLALVAAGRFDAYWERGLSAWDMAAGVLLVREAGGYVSDADGGETILRRGIGLRRQRSDAPAFASTHSCVMMQRRADAELRSGRIAPRCEGDQDRQMAS